jgi:hypothetical protein
VEPIVRRLKAGRITEFLPDATKICTVAKNSGEAGWLKWCRLATCQPADPTPHFGGFGQFIFGLA